MGSAADEVPVSDFLDLYLLVGQSNMAGRGKVEESDRIPVPGIFVLNEDGEWKNQGEPVHFDKPDLIGVGLGFTFARDAREIFPDRPVGLIPCAVGGTPQERWMPGGDLYENALTRARIALRRGNLKGILWHQGESECGDPFKAAAYGGNLRQIVEGFRKDLNTGEIPFIAGELGAFLEDLDGDSHFKVINAQTHLLPHLAARTAVVSSHGLTDQGDHLHFDARSFKEFGHRYFKAFQELSLET